MAAVKSFGERIADALVEDGLLTSKQVDELLEQQKKGGTRLLKLILEKAYVSEQDMAVCMGRVLNTPPINLSRINIPLETADLIPREVAQTHKVVPVSRLENKLFIAMADPLNVLALDDVRRITRLEVAPMIASEKSILDKLASFEAAKGGSMEEIIQESQRENGDDEVEIKRESIEEVNLDQLAASSEEAPVIKLANLILVQAIKDRASDIHIEPFEKGMKLRYRIDGVLTEATPPPKHMQLALASRFKIMSSLDIAERRLPQDGRMRVRVSGKDYDLRVSIMPTVHGEKIVLRVLDKSNLSASLDKLGLDPDTFQQVKAAVDAPHGLLLVTGPTGSGKTTTLYSALNELNNPIYNIITVEDPVEFQIPGINQVPVKKEIGLTFANALRSILRQDPDIIMIGEIRDTETAEIAIEAALTGHQVLSTMHCNDAPGAIARLDDMGIAPFLISSSVILSCAQRLMRRICSHCKEPVTYPEKMFQDLNIDPSTFDGVTLYRGRGCERCRNSGYAGRLAIIEAMTVTDEIRKLIIARANTREMAKVAIGQGMRTLRMVALDRVRDGLSTLEQVLVLTAAH
ncbi:MAG TPA: Flp pilus assembly complex ATPase component TadA [Verrucomicrobia bacterium]|nr:Flp pilus assembly complex ATPase component TadA [Verrucomicrobiota bacterium]HOP96974.1 ATPase, T2SS/T4P/T4SS family [Verrucomicrobiota bacterium]